MEHSITFSTEVPNFNDCSEFYYFITFKLDDSKITKEISNVDLIILSRLSYEETLKTIKDVSISEKFNVYVKSIVEKFDIPFENAKFVIRYVGISPDNLFGSKLIDFENKCN